MELTFVRADHEVTGSCHALHVGDKNILVDYGMEQGKDLFQNIPLPVAPEDVDYCLITHAHIDHTGMLPELYAKGFRGTIICTKATKELSDIMLRDSAHIQMQDAEYNNKKAEKRGIKTKEEPLYTMQDTMNVLQRFKAYPYDEIFEVCEGVKARFTDIGHLLGSASIELWLTENGQTRKIVFSGDIGNTNQPLLRDPKTTSSADYVVMESTYGDRYHEKQKGRHKEQLAEVIENTMKCGGNVVIPAFAVGRTQAILYFIRQIKEQNLVPSYPDFPVYVDSPMAVSSTNIFENNDIECYDEEAKAMVARGANPLFFPNLHLSITTQESIAINEDPEPKVIISASGMCDAGRIRHHLKHNISNPNATILFVGYQSEGTLGRRLLSGASKVKIFGTEYEVKAHIAQMDGLSGHADKDGLLSWINAFEEKPKQVFVVHGDDEAATSFAECLSSEYGYEAMAPYSGTKYDLLAGSFIRIAKPVLIKKEAKLEEGVQTTREAAGEVSETKGGKKKGTVLDSYSKLQIAARRLNRLIENSEGMSGKELDEFTKEINRLCRKYK